MDKSVEFFVPKNFHEMDIWRRAYCEGIDIRFDSTMPHEEQFNLLRKKLYAAITSVSNTSS